jgi:subtilisin family serine protease
VIRRALAVCVATACASVLVLPQPSVSASSEPAPFTEEIARTMVTSSPQTVGPQNGALSWGLDRIDQRTAVSLPASYSFSSNGAGVKAYILDSGVSATHPDFGSRVVDGWSYRASTSALASYQSALIAYANNPNTGIRPCANNGTYALNPATFDNPNSPDVADKGKTDNDGHGTHVAGIVGGDTTGVAKGVTIVPVRTLDSCGNGTRTMIIEALQWILNDHVAGQKAILNLSIGFDSQVASVDSKITELMNKGIVVIAAAGNDAISACGTTPASTLGTISVGSSTVVDGESTFSNYGQCVDIFSPGESIRSTYPFLSGVTDTYATQSGTSMSAPFVSGVIARYLQSLGAGPTSFETGPSASWSWLRMNATCGVISYASRTDSNRTPNRLLASADAPVAPPCAPNSLQVVASTQSVTVQWAESVSGNGASISHVVTASPGNATCSSASTSCTVSGLSSGTTYTFSVSAVNTAGQSAPATISGTTVGPVVAPPPVVIPPPTTPTETFISVSSRALTLTWSSVSSSLPVTYVVTNSDGVTVCTTTATGCVVQGLLNGKEYSFTVAAQTSSGTSSATPTIVARPGFRVIKTTAARKSQPLLSSFVRSVSTGRRTWSESGPCSIKGTRLVTPKKKSTCVITLRVAKTKKYPAMSTRVTIVVS